ncbi:MAG: imidazole glycerol phosphate synthase subunit HisH [Lachnospiraceae bacterium]|nr:imidazole glycerol phosphate synthase subunit HisH [Lachnospiraceae bacterium]
MIAIVDYGVGNLFSLKCSVGVAGEYALITSDKREIEQADRVILPGVGAFGDAMEKLRRCGLVDVVREQALSGKPFLGICLGMQLLFERSYEFGTHEGLALIPGEVRPIADAIPDALPIPHMGWNALRFRDKDGDGSLFASLKEGAHAYFVHSYAAFDCEESVRATCEYGALLTAAVRKDNIHGLQFHPEKSGEAGLSMLRAFARLPVSGKGAA